MPKPNDPEFPSSQDPAATPSDELVETPTPNAEEPGRVADLEGQLQAARQEILRSQAELENYRKRVRRDMDEERRYAALPLLGDLLPVIDNLQRALSHADPTQGDSSPLIQGVRMIVQQLDGILEKHHCRRIPAAGELFDPHVHAAIGQQPSDEHPAGVVTHVAVEGYQLHDRVIRPSQVLVSTGPAANNSVD